MTDRKGEKIGWTAGWLGGFLWVAIIAILFLFQGKWPQAVSGLALAGAAVFCILFFAPWRFPSTACWKLMLIPWTVLMLSVAWAVWVFGGFASEELRWWHFLWVLFIITPLCTIGGRKWEQAGGISSNPADTGEKQP